MRHASPTTFLLCRRIQTQWGLCFDNAGTNSPPHSPPTRKPLNHAELTGANGYYNSRFFTDCYHLAAVFAPPGRRKRFSGTIKPSRHPSKMAKRPFPARPAAPGRSNNFLYFHTLNDTLQMPSCPAAVASLGPGRYRNTQTPPSGDLAAQEGRYLVLVRFRRIMHRRLPTMRVQRLVLTPFPILRHRLLGA